MSGTMGHPLPRWKSERKRRGEHGAQANGQHRDFFQELGLELEDRAPIEGEWAARVTGLGDHVHSR